MKIIELLDKTPETEQLWSKVVHFIKTLDDELVENYITIDFSKFVTLPAIVENDEIICFSGLQVDESKWGPKIGRCSSRMWIHPNYRKKSLTTFSGGNQYLNSFFLVPIQLDTARRIGLEACFISREKNRRGFARYLQLVQNNTGVEFVLLPNTYDVSGADNSLVVQHVGIWDITGNGLTYWNNSNINRITIPHYDPMITCFAIDTALPRTSNDQILCVELTPTNSDNCEFLDSCIRVAKNIATQNPDCMLILDSSAECQAALQCFIQAKERVPKIGIVHTGFNEDEVQLMVQLCTSLLLSYVVLPISRDHLSQKLIQMSDEYGVTNFNDSIYCIIRELSQTTIVVPKFPELRRDLWNLAGSWGLLIEEGHYRCVTNIPSTHNNHSIDLSFFIKTTSQLMKFLNNPIIQQLTTNRLIGKITSTSLVTTVLETSGFVPYIPNIAMPFDRQLPGAAAWFYDNIQQLPNFRVGLPVDQLTTCLESNTKTLWQYS